MSGHYANTHSWEGPARNTGLPDPSHMAHLVSPSTLHEYEQERRSLSTASQEAREEARRQIRVSEWSEAESEPESEPGAEATHVQRGVTDEAAAEVVGVGNGFWHGNGRKLEAYSFPDSTLNITFGNHHTTPQLDAPKKEA
ncbi:hypothetical protein CFE70_010133 [Pyrenophora teres f. teres 0-1]